MNAKTVLCAFAFAALASAGYAAPTVVVDQKGMKFSVQTLTIKKGSTIRFTNSDPTVHNIFITGESGRVDGGLQSPGHALNVPFMKAGAYQVTCGIHPKMKLLVLVQ